MVPTREYIRVDSPIAGVYHTNGIYYNGKLVKYQLEGNKYRGKRYLQTERDPLTDYQNFMYRCALYGLNAVSPEDIKYMHRDKKRRITKLAARSRKAINVLKQEIINKQTNSMLSMLHNSGLVRDLIKNFSGTDPDFDNKLTLRDLGITKVHVANRLIEVGVLPKNFYELKKDPNGEKRLPRFKQPADSVPIPG